MNREMDERQPILSLSFHVETLLVSRFFSPSPLFQTNDTICTVWSSLPESPPFLLETHPSFLSLFFFSERKPWSTWCFASSSLPPLVSSRRQKPLFHGGENSGRSSAFQPISLSLIIEWIRVGAAESRNET